MVDFSVKSLMIEGNSVIFKQFAFKVLLVYRWCQLDGNKTDAFVKTSCLCVYGPHIGYWWTALVRSFYKLEIHWYDELTDVHTKWWKKYGVPKGYTDLCKQGPILNYRPIPPFIQVKLPTKNLKTNPHGMRTEARSLTGGNTQLKCW